MLHEAKNTNAMATQAIARKTRCSVIQFIMRLLGYHHNMFQKRYLIVITWNHVSRKTAPTAKDCTE